MKVSLPAGSETERISPDHPLVAKAREFVPLLARHAAESDRLGRLSDEVAKALYEEGFLSLHAPRALGGHEASFRTAFDVYTEFGRACGSSAWTAMVLSGGSFMVSLLGPKARQEIWGGDPRVAVCSQMTAIGTARPVDGGIAVSGRWRPTSGVHQSTWAMVAVSMAEESAEDDESVVLAVLPVGEGSIEHSWQVTGLRATGSDTLVFDGVFVPGHRLLSFPRMVAGGYAGEHPGEPLYGATVINALTVTVVAPLLGMTEAALDRAVEQLGADARKPAPRRAGSASVRTALAEAASRVDTARLRIRRALDDIEHGIRTGSQLAPLARARVSMDAGTAAENLREAMRLLLTAVGSGAFSLDQALQRTWRDVEISLAHSAISPDATRAAYGHALLNTAAGG